MKAEASLKPGSFQSRAKLNVDFCVFYIKLCKAWFKVKSYKHINIRNKFYKIYRLINASFRTYTIIISISKGGASTSKPWKLSWYHMKCIWSARVYFTLLSNGSLMLKVGAFVMLSRLLMAYENSSKF